MPADLKRKLEETASANGRSMNAEIVQRLQDSFACPKSKSIEITIHADKSLTMRELNEVLNDIKPRFDPSQSISLNVVFDNGTEQA